MRQNVTQQQNIFTHSEDLTASGWTVSDCTVANSSQAGPFGPTITVSGMTDDSVASTTHFVNFSSTSIKGQTYTFSIYVKPAPSGRYICLSGNSAGCFVNFDLTGSGAIGTAYGSISTSYRSATIQAMQNGWYRISLTTLNTFATAAPVRIYSAVNLVSNNYTGTTTLQLYIFGAQLTTSSGPVQYTQTVASSINAGSAPPRILLPQAQNLLQQSQDFTQAVWVKNSGVVPVTATAAAIIAPDGTLTGQAIISTTTTSGSHIIFQGNDPVTLGGYQTFSCYAHAGAVNNISLLQEGTFAQCYYTLTGNGSINNISSGPNPATAGIRNVGNGWYYCWLIALRQHAASSVSIYITNVNNSVTYASGDTTTAQVYLWGTQIVQANYPGPYQVTTAAAVNNGPIRRLVAPTQNLITFSQDFTQIGSWLKVGCSITANAITAPDGTNTGQALVANTLTNSFKYFDYNPAVEPLNKGQQACASIYVKAGAVSWFNIEMDHATLSYWYNLSGAGSLGATPLTSGGATNIQASIQNVGGGWYRCILSCIRGQNSFAQGIQFVAVNADNGGTYTAGDTSSAQVYLWGAQYVQANYPGPYQVTTAAIVNNGPIRSLTVQNQNLLTNSDDLSQAAWVPSHTIITANQGINPITGAGTVALVSDDNSNGLHSIQESVSASSDLYTASAIVKAGTNQWIGLICNVSGTSGSFFDIINGVVGSSVGTIVSASITAVPNSSGWWKVSITLQTSPTSVSLITAPSNGTPSYQGTSSLNFLVAHVQMVKANYPGPYTLTTGSPVNTGAIRSTA